MLSPLSYKYPLIIFSGNSNLVRRSLQKYCLLGWNRGQEKAEAIRITENIFLCFCFVLKGRVYMTRTQNKFEHFNNNQLNLFKSG
jgi:hypothetical protein